MTLVVFARADSTPIAVNADDVVHLAPVPKSGPLMGPLSEGTRIVFRNQSHQDVKELFDVVVARMNASGTGAAMPRAAAPRKRK